MKPRTDLLQGTLEMLVLTTLADEPMHGWGICERVQELSEDVLKLNHGSLYPALQRLKRRGWVRSEWRRSENNRRARYYALTAAGRSHLGDEIAQWRRSSQAVERILDLLPRAGR